MSFCRFGLKEHILCHKGREEIVLHLLVSVDFLKSIPHAAIEDIKLIFKFGLKHK